MIAFNVPRFLQLFNALETRTGGQTNGFSKINVGNTALILESGKNIFFSRNLLIEPDQSLTQSTEF